MKFKVINKFKKINSYKIDGSSHYLGIKNEDTVLNYLNSEYKNGNDLLNLEVFDGIQFIKKGNTNHKADIIAITNNLTNPITISIKKHSKKSGTLDYLNTSKLEKYISPHLVASFKNLINEVKQKYYKNNNKLDFVRKQINKMTNEFLHEIANDIDITIKKMIDDINLNLCDYLIISWYNEKNKINFKIIKKDNRFDFNRFLNCDL